MQVTLHLMAGNNVSQDPVDIPHQNTDELTLDFQVDGCFRTTQKDDFTPPLPNYRCTKGSHTGPYKPRLSNHDTKYQWDTSENCKCEGEKGKRIAMHTIHTGNVML